MPSSIRFEDKRAIEESAYGEWLDDKLKVFSVKEYPYGARGDGVADDTLAIRQAIADALIAGGGIVFFPPGTYNYCTQDVSELAGITLNNPNNIVLRGAGKGLSKLKKRARGNKDPSLYWDVVSNKVYRGHGILIKISANTSCSNVIIEDLEIDGGVAREDGTYPLTGASQPPVTTPGDGSATTGSGWDGTHQGITINTAVPGGVFTNLLIRRCNIHSWRGELVYYGGAGVTDVWVDDCDIHDSNASMISMSCRLKTTNSRLYHGVNAFEVSHYQWDMTIKNNIIYDCRKGFVDAGQVALTAQGFGRLLVAENTFRSCYGDGLWITGYQENALIKDNSFFDCGYGTVELSAIRVLGQYGGDPRRVEILNNQIFADTQSCNAGIYLTGGLRDIVVRGNYVGQTSYGKTNSKTMAQGIRYDVNANSGTTPSNIIVEFNTWDNCGFGVNIASFSTTTYIGTHRFNRNLNSGVYTTTTNGGGATMNIGTDTHYILGSGVAAYESITTIQTGRFDDGQEVDIISQSASNGAYLPVSGTGFQLKAPFFSANAVLRLRYDAASAKWMEVSRRPAIATDPKLTANVVKLSGETLEAKAPVIQAYGCGQVTIAPVGATDFNNWANFPINLSDDGLVCVIINANVTLKHNTGGANRLILAGAVDYAPGGNGAMVWFRINGNNAYEVSRVAL